MESNKARERSVSGDYYTKGGGGGCSRWFGRAQLIPLGDKSPDGAKLRGVPLLSLTGKLAEPQF